MERLINPDNSLAFSFLRDDKPVFDLSLGGWGPQWAWVGLDAHQKAEDGRVSARVPFVVNKDKGEVIDVHFEAWQPGARQVAFRYSLESAKDVPLTMLMAGLHFDPENSKGTLTLTHADGKQTKIGLPHAESARRRPRRRPISPSTRAAWSRCSSTRRAPSASTAACAWCWRPTRSPRASVRDADADLPQ